MKFAAAFVSALALSAALHAADGGPAQDGQAAIEALGRVNGQALACNQPAIGSRARNALVTGAPRSREVGEAFEAATSAAFLEQGRGSACPDAVTLSQDLAAAEARLRAAFPAK